MATPGSSADTKRRHLNGSYGRSLLGSAVLPLLAVTTLPVARADMMPYTAIPSPSSSDPDYHHQVAIESYASRLQYLAEFNLGDDGSFEIALNILLTIAVPHADEGRDMLHLLACEEDAVQAFLDVPSKDDDGSRIHVPSYCAMTNRTLDYYCQSFPLEDGSPDEFVYQSFKVVSGSMAEMAPTAYSLLSQSAHGDTKDSRSGSGIPKKVLFFIDSCETMGGQTGILRSCLKNPPGGDQTPCFYCPKNYPSSYSSQISGVAEDEGCNTPPPLPPTIRGTVSMNLCNAQGDCLGKRTNVQLIFYALSTLVWGVTAFVWVVHIRAAAHDAVIELQNKMKLIPITHVFYSLLTLAEIYTEDKLEGTARSLVQNAAVLAQLVALAVYAEVVVVIAKGWKITRHSLLPREVQWIRFVTMSWAGSFAVLKHTSEKQLAVVIIWGMSWACVVFMVWYNSAFNLNMLKYQLAMVRQLDVDPQLTPVYTKSMLFRRFRALLAAYIFWSCILGVVGLVNDATHHSSEWISLVGNEGLTLLLFVALGYTFRCRRFGRLRSTIASQADHTVRSIDQGAVHRGSILPEPATADPVEPPKRNKTIVVLNPDQAPWLATALSTQPAATPDLTP